MMPTTIQTFGLTIATGIAACMTQGLAAQTSTPTTVANEMVDDSAWIGVVTSATTPIRCGANESYYPIATAQKGNLIRIVGKRQEWLKCEADGGVFQSTIGYVKYPSSNEGALTISGETGTATMELEVLANNIESEELYRSWRPIYRLNEGDTVTVVTTTNTDPGTLHRDAYFVHTVSIPSKATGWIHQSAITKANDEQSAAWGDWTQTVATTVTVSESSEIDSMADVATVVANLVTTSEETIETAAAEEHASEETFTPLSLAELEVKWNKMADEQVMGAEVTPLRDMYTELLSSSAGDLVVERIATNRIKQLDVWAGLQSQRVKIDNLKNELAEKAQNVNEYRDVFESFDGYAITGKLALSNTFDGRLRPFLYRIQDPKTGRTLGYVKDQEEFQFGELVGQIVGIKGEAAWDPHWRVQMVEGTSLDLVSPTTATVSPDIQ